MKPIPSRQAERERDGWGERERTAVERHTKKDAGIYG